MNFVMKYLREIELHLVSSRYSNLWIFLCLARKSRPAPGLSNWVSFRAKMSFGKSSKRFPTRKKGPRQAVGKELAMKDHRLSMDSSG